MTNTPPDTLRLLVDENRVLLQQGIDLVEELPEQIYTQDRHEHFKNGVGKHFRHVLDFYDRFVFGSNDQVDYDRRARDPRLESDPVFAAKRAGELSHSLESLVELDPKSDLTVCVETRAPDGVGLTAESSSLRELAFLASHTVHHYAIIKLLLSLQGQSAPEHFGIAPSTLRYEENLAKQ